LLVAAGGFDAATRVDRVDRVDRVAAVRAWLAREAFGDAGEAFAPRDGAADFL
jgi:hypothetical protein